MVDVASVLRARRKLDAPIQHIFTIVTVMIGKLMLEINVMIDSGSIWDLVSHLFARKHQLPDYRNISNNLKSVDGSPLQVYGQHLLQVTARGEGGNNSTLRQLFLTMPITGRVELIQGLPWLRAARPSIDWVKGHLSFSQGDGLANGPWEKDLLVGDARGNTVQETPEAPPVPEDATPKSKAIPVRRKTPKVGGYVRTEHSDAEEQADVSLPDIALVTEVEMHEIIRTEGVQGYLVQWRDREDEGGEKN